MSAKNGEVGDLTAQEFSNLLFNRDEKMTINFRQIPAPSIEEKKKTTQKFETFGVQRVLDLGSLSQKELG